MPKVAGYEDIIIIRNDADNPLENKVCYADMSYHKLPIFTSIIHRLNIPLVGDDPLWVNMVAVAEGQSAPMWQFSTALTARHTFQKGFPFVNGNGQNDCAAGLAKTINRRKASKHSVIRKHPVAGARPLFVNTVFTEALNKLAANESNAMFWHLYSRIDNPRYQMWLKLRRGTVVMLDIGRFICLRRLLPEISRRSAGYS